MKKPDDNNMLGSEYLHEVTNVSRIFGRQHDISVVVEGNMAGVDRDGNIVYPSIAADSRLTPEEISISRGYVDHECGHKRHTDLPAFFAYGDKCRKNGEELKLGIANAMEDPRMEAKVIDDYEGSHENLTAVANSVCRSWRDEHGVTAYSLHQQGETHEQWYQFVGGALSILGRRDCWGFGGQDYDLAVDTFEALLGKERMAQCREFSKRLAKLTSTKQVLTLADEVGEWIRQEYKQDQQQQQSQQGQQSQQQGAQGAARPAVVSSQGMSQNGQDSPKLGTISLRLRVTRTPMVLVRTPMVPLTAPMVPVTVTPMVRVIKIRVPVTRIKRLQAPTTAMGRANARARAGGQINKAPARVTSSRTDRVILIRTSKAPARLVVAVIRWHHRATVSKWVRLCKKPSKANSRE